MSESIEPTEAHKPKSAKKPALGRGLGSLLGENRSEEPASIRPETPAPVVIPAQPTVPEHARIWQMDVAKVHANPKQPRRNFVSESLRELAASIKEKGILQPVVVRRLPDGQLEIIAGERRWRAAQMAGLKEIPIIIKNSPDQDALELALIENLQREDLNPIETAEAYSHIVKTYGLTQQALADRLGMERATVANTLRLLGLAPLARTLLLSSQISMGHAKVLLSLSDHEHQADFAKKVAEKKLSVRELERQIARWQFNRTEDGADVPREQASDANTMRDIGEELQKIMGTKVGIDYAQGRGRITIHFYSDEEFNEIVDRARRAWRK
jgi:ParB family transcriptional regulator, chromosome partitioning protein